MDDFSATSMLTLNSSFLEQTSLPADDSQLTFASAYNQLDVTRVLWMIVPPVLLVLGCYGNVMTIVVMRAMRASESTGCLSVYFTALAVSDLFLLWTNVLLYWPEMVFNAPLAYFHDLSCRFTFFVSNAASMMSAWFLVAMTCQRMTSVILPHRVEALCTLNKGRILTVTIAVASCLANFHILFYFHVEHLEQGYPSCVINDKTAAGIFSSLFLSLASVVPFFCLIVANAVLILGALKSVRMSRTMIGNGDTRASSRRSKVSSMTTTLILTSVAFLVLTVPSSILLIYFEMTGYYEGEIEDERLTQQLALADTVSLLLWMSNSAINFYIYVLSGRKFREEAKRYMCMCFQQQRKATQLNP